LIIAEGRDELARCVAGWKKANHRLQTESDRLRAELDDLRKITSGSKTARLVAFLQQKLAKPTMTVPKVAGIVLLSIILTVAVTQKLVPPQVKPPLVDNTVAMVNAEAARCTAMFTAERNQMQAQIRMMYRQLAEASRAPQPSSMCAFPRPGCIFERRIGQETACSRIDPMFLGLTDYASLVEAVSFNEHQSRRRSVFDWKNYFRELNTQFHRKKLNDWWVERT